MGSGEYTTSINTSAKVVDELEDVQEDRKLHFLAKKLDEANEKQLVLQKGVNLLMKDRGKQQATKSFIDGTTAKVALWIGILVSVIGSLTSCVGNL